MALIKARNLACLVVTLNNPLVLASVKFFKRYDRNRVGDLSPGGRDTPVLSHVQGIQMMPGFSGTGCSVLKSLRTDLSVFLTSTLNEYFIKYRKTNVYFKV